MSSLRALVTSLALLLSTHAAAGDETRKLMEIGAEECEYEMAVLDRLAINLGEEPDATGYLIVYGGRRDTKRDEVRIRGARMKRYLVESRGVSRVRVVVVAGGYREKFAVEMWLVPRGERFPAPTPTLRPAAVRFRKGRMERWREPGCFPGKYRVPNARASGTNALLSGRMFMFKGSLGSGLVVEWDGDEEKRIDLPEIVWQRRTA